MSRALRRNLPDPVFLGFCAKEYVPASDVFGGAFELHRQDICSVSACIAERPVGWVERWDFNCAVCYPSAEAAISTVPVPDRERYRMYAYRLIPVLFPAFGSPGAMEPDGIFAQALSLGALPAEPDMSAYIRLGYDVAQHDLRLGIMPWQCSPLSCNGLASEFHANRCCLMDTLSEAYRAAVSFAREQPEPGDYLIVEVLRREAGAA